MKTWESPSDYMGFNPTGDYILYARTRDSGLLVNHNWDELVKAMKVGEDECPNTKRYDNGTDDTVQAVYTFRAGHWACGWVEYLMVNADADVTIIETAQSLADDLEDYPILNEDGYYQKVSEACDEYWNDLSMKEKVEIWMDKKDDDTSLFAVRSGYDYDGCVREYIESIVEE